MTAPQGPTAGAGISQAVTGQAVTAQVTATLASSQDMVARLVDLVPGQGVQGTVVQILGDGQVMLGLLGGQVQAAMNLTLTAGKTYDFTVTQVQPQIVLTAERPLVLPNLAGAAAAGLLGPSGPALAAVLSRALQEIPAPALAKAPRQARHGDAGGPAARQALQQFLARLAAGLLEAVDLERLHRLLGHDQEARVLRLPPKSSHQAAPQDVAVLQQTLKAELLRFLDLPPAAHKATADAAGRALVEGFGRIEADNAHRADQGAPQWLPLPVLVGGFLKDARLFLLARAEADAEQDGARVQAKGFTVVLLLDLTRLGQVRVDVEVHGDAVAATFRLVDSSSLHLLHSSKDELQERLESEGLTVRHIRVQPAPGAGDSLPVADLLTPPRSDGPGDPNALVDIHA